MATQKNFAIKNGLTVAGTERISASGDITGSHFGTFSGTSTTRAAGTNNTQLATTAFVTGAISDLVDSAPGTLNTLNELAAALNDDASFSTTITNSIATKAPLASPVFTGNVGVGESSPSAKTHIKKAAAATQHYDAYATLIVEDPEARIQVVATNGGSNASSILLTNETQHWGVVHHGTGKSNNFGIGYTTSSSSGGDYADTLSDALTITTAGNVGIGSDAPGAVRLYATTAANGNLAGQFINTHATGSYGVKIQAGSSASNYGFVVTDKDNSNPTHFYVRGDGNVGIGTNSPGQLLTVGGITGGADGTLSVKTNSNTHAIAIEENSGNENYQLGVTSGGNLDFYNSGATDPTVTFSDSDYVGIGTNNPFKKLHIQGGGYDQIMINSAGGSNTNRLSGICGIDYTGNQFSILQNYAQSGSQITYYGSADGSFRGVQGHQFMVNATSTANSGHTKAFEIRSDGDVHAAYTGSADTTGYFYAGKDWGATNHRINRNVSQGSNVLVISAYGGTGIFADTALFYAAATGGKNAAATAVGIEKNSVTSRSINAAGTLNASGNDYAEYMEKKEGAFEIAKGDICGVNENGKLTNKFTEAHSFVVKSTDPSYVGGDIWGNEDVVGKRPELTRQGYVNPEKEVAETDEEYAVRKTKYEADLAEFEEKLEAQRIKYDRIAFSGQVPVNVTGATVGDYIIAKAGTSDSIIGEAVSSPTFEQYQLAVGKVWKILEDGRAFISVKIG